MANLSLMTLDNAIGYLRDLLNEVSPQKLQTIPIVYYINMAQLKLATILIGEKKPDYEQSLIIKNSASAAGEVELTVGSDVTKAAVTLTADYAANKLRIDSIGSVVYVHTDNKVYPAVEVSPMEFETLANNPLKKEEVYYYFFGEKLYINNRITGISLEADWGTITVYYYRYPAKLLASALTDTLDVRDGHVRVLLEDVKLMILEELENKPLDNISEAISSAVEQAGSAISDSGMFQAETVNKDQS